MFRCNIKTLVYSLVFLVTGCAGDIDVYKPVEAPFVTNQIKVTKVWSRSIGSGVDDFYSQLSPVFDDENIYAASRDGDVYAFNKLTGERLWDIDLDDEIENDDRRSSRLSGVSIGDNHVYVSSENGYLYTLDKTEGNLLWKVDVGAEILAVPTTDNEKVYVLSINGEVFAYDCFTGEQQWQTGIDNVILSLRGNSNPIVIDGVVMYGTVEGKINLISAQNGLLLQQLKVGIPSGKTKLERLADVNASPLLISNELYAVAYKGDFQGYLLPSANVIWKRQYNSSQNMAFDLSDIAFTDTSGHVYAIIRIDGSQRWVNTALTYRKVTSPSYFKDYVLVGDYEGYLYWLDNATGEFKAMIQVDDSGLYTAPIADEDLVYIQTKGGDLYAYKLEE